jgi:hypothetical protein
VVEAEHRPITAGGPALIGLRGEHDADCQGAGDNKQDVFHHAGIMHPLCRAVTPNRSAFDVFPRQFEEIAALLKYTGWGKG